MNYENFEIRLNHLKAELLSVVEGAGRNIGDVLIQPVTKTHPAEVVEWVQRAGLPGVGENRVQEAIDKKQQIGNQTMRWDLIGHLQSNKAKTAIQYFDRIQSVDSLSLAHRLNRLAGECGKKYPILLQFNTGDDPAKFGFREQEKAEVFSALSDWGNLLVEGFMTIAPYTDDESIIRQCFSSLRIIRDRAEDHLGTAFPVLSMGMSGDWKIAVEEGSTLIRPGSALFGDR